MTFFQVRSLGKFISDQK